MMARLVTDETLEPDSSHHPGAPATATPTEPSRHRYNLQHEEPGNLASSVVLATHKSQFYSVTVRRERILPRMLELIITADGS